MLYRSGMDQEQQYTCLYLTWWQSKESFLFFVNGAEGQLVKNQPGSQNT